MEEWASSLEAPSNQPIQLESSHYKERKWGEMEQSCQDVFGCLAFASKQPPDILDLGRKDF